MFGLVYAIIIFFAIVISGIKCAIEDNEQISKAKELKAEGKNKHDLYTDRLGHTRDLRTGQLRHMDYVGCEAEGKDQYLRDMYGNPVKNISEERRWERVAEARADARRTVSLWKPAIIYHKRGREGNPPWYGNEYRDLENGRKYVCRTLTFPHEINEKGGGGKYYMDTQTGLLVREADCQIFDRKHGKYEYSEEMNKAFIEFFNKKQSTTGYFRDSKRPRVSGWDQVESESDKQKRLDDFYCNRDNCLDEPRRY